MKIFAIPLLLGVISLIGLIAALVFEGPVDILWGGAVAVPLGVIALCLVRAQRR